MNLKELVKKLRLARKLVSWKMVDEVKENLMEMLNDKAKSNQAAKDKKPGN